MPQPPPHPLALTLFPVPFLHVLCALDDEGGVGCLQIVPFMAGPTQVSQSLTTYVLTAAHCKEKVL